MADHSHMTAAEMERDVEAQRERIERRIGDIQERLSPGQLLDEALGHVRHGGAKFASTLGDDLASNPIPTALLGVSLAWLIAGANRPRGDHPHTDAHLYGREPEYPYATISSGSLRRVSHTQQSAGDWVSEFADDTGRKFKASADAMGHRAGHFVDDTGRSISGFIDSAGNRITDFRDETGAMMDEAMGWASHTWRDAKEAVGRAAGDALAGLRKAGAGASQMAHEAGHMASDAKSSVRNLASDASHIAGDMQAQTEQLARALMRTFENQPLVAGALAFAAGAAIGAIVPNTAEEDAAFGKAADDLKSRAAEVAEEFYEEGKERVEALYEHGKEEVGKAYDKAARQVEESYRQVSEVTNGNGKPADLH
jgi:hypothetical protein